LMLLPTTMVSALWHHPRPPLPPTKQCAACPLVRPTPSIITDFVHHLLTPSIITDFVYHLWTSFIIADFVYHLLMLQAPVGSSCVWPPALTTAENCNTLSTFSTLKNCNTLSRTLFVGVTGSMLGPISKLACVCCCIHMLPLSSSSCF